MIEKITSFLKLLMYLSLVFMFTSLGILALQIRTSVDDTTKLVGIHIKDVGSDLHAALNVKDKNSLLSKLNKVAYDTKSLITHTDELVYKQKKYSDEQNLRLIAILSKSEDSLDRINAAVDSADYSQKQVAEESVRTLSEVQATLRESQITLKASTQTIEIAGKVIDDKNIPALLDHIELTSEHIESTTARVDKAVERWTKPAAWWKTAISTIFGLGSQGRVLITGGK